MSIRDIYSNFGFYNALSADVYSAEATGVTIDLQGFGAAVIALIVHSFASGGAGAAAKIWAINLQHGLASDAGVSTWSLVPESLIIHSVYGGYDSTGETGRFAFLSEAADASQGSGAIFFVGYKGDKDHRYLRVVMSVSGATSALWAGAVAILGNPDNWAVNDPVQA